MDKRTANHLIPIIQAALSQIAADHGMTVEIRGGTFNAGSFTPRVTFLEANAAQAEWELYTRYTVLQAADFGRTFTANGRQHTIIGFAPKSRRMPIITKTNDGKQWKHSEESVRRLLDKETGVDPLTGTAGAR